MQTCPFCDKPITWYEITHGMAVATPEQDYEMAHAYCYVNAPDGSEHPFGEKDYDVDEFFDDPSEKDV